MTTRLVLAYCVTFLCPEMTNIKFITKLDSTASSLLPWQMKRSLLNKKLYYKRLNKHVKIGKVRAKWV